MLFSFLTASPTRSLNRTVSALSSSHCSWSIRSCSRSISFCLDSSSLNKLAIAVAICRAAEITVRMIDAFSTVDIEVAVACAVACVAVPAASAVCATPFDTLLPTSPIAEITSPAASTTSSMKPSALSMLSAISPENMRASFDARPPRSVTTVPADLSCVANVLYDFVTLFRAFNARWSACWLLVFASVSFFSEAVTRSLASASSWQSCASSPVSI